MCLSLIISTVVGRFQIFLWAPRVTRMDRLARHSLKRNSLTYFWSSLRTKSFVVKLATILASGATRIWEICLLRKCIQLLAFLVSITRLLWKLQNKRNKYASLLVHWWHKTRAARTKFSPFMRVTNKKLSPSWVWKLLFKGSWILTLPSDLL